MIGNQDLSISYATHHLKPFHYASILLLIELSKIVTDRFAVGNGTYPPCNPAERKYCGGDWRGIINSLDYIQNMGFDAIWISPVSTQVDSGAEGDPYHGYVFI